MTLRVFSFGGGVQSTAVLVLAAQGRVTYDAYIFSNVGEDSENPDTLAYFRVFAQPFALRFGLPLIEIRKQWRDGRAHTLLQALRAEKRGVMIPARMTNGAPGNRNCTKTFKIDVIAKWQREHGATTESPAITGLGISTDEIRRARTDSGIAYQKLEYPLLSLRLSRDDCKRIITEAGLPLPPKSSCWFCPFKTYREWASMKRDKPALFRQAVALEAELGQRMGAIGRDPVWLSQHCRPLEDAFSADQLSFDEAWDTCESGYCFT